MYARGRALRCTFASLLVWPAVAVLALTVSAGPVRADVPSGLASAGQAAHAAKCQSIPGVATTKFLKL